jgi:putative YphP/YqiW family bacilliredoxin
MDSLYDREAVRPMWEELVNVGFRPLTTAEEVDEALSQTEGVTLLVVNSVCGCAAGGARPAVMLALQHERIPDRLVTVFAGVDQEAVGRAREYLPEYAPSSPFIALFKDGHPVFVLERVPIEQMDVKGLVKYLVQAFDEYCAAPGPSIPREEFEKVVPHDRCGSTVPLNQPE